MWDVIGDGARQGARLRILTRGSGREVTVEMRLGEIVEGNQLTLELWWPGVGGGKKEDEELLAASAHNNCLAQVEAALRRGANVNATDCLADTPLHRASYNGHVKVVQILLAAGANLNTQGFRCSPLHQAVRNGHVEVAEVLLAAGADPNPSQRIPEGYTPLHSAAETATSRDEDVRDTPHLQVVTILSNIQSCANLRQTGERWSIGASTTHVATRMMSGQQGETPLHIAATYNKIEVLKAFLAVGADVSARNTDGKTPLDSAKHEGHSDIIALLQQESEPLTKCAQGSASQ
eukprot:CAMPEP_0175960888 /NCGR_PEP_ID=MMETSP0108-20121206/35623_1 /TAXON_ID=195067 ORGANISM="Goniomonas pacifica, Strain CCMP1869" /NCGR_SAMPLE_ID=MMETSP0108 /ASSEMBLY_ACC=CAM_ASM_000204 /LENGTH=291 /DNA_ID=CAMNT_0017288543 /DNA_START=378 /DNA_END=1254 /DNA_ORIENTATION=+